MPSKKMKDQKIFDSNCLIAEFMGWTASKYKQTLGGGGYNIIEWVDDKDETTYAGGDSWSLTDKDGKDYSPPFHRDWGYLMDAVERIESMGYKFKICRKRCQICLDDEHERFIVDVKMDSKLLSAHEAVYQFIQKIK